ncbi:MAG: putative TetR-family transcriptional regulator [Glaciihabitans sp.]|nr:putative TetR-family transcriptional regulator [Glaciihabitans sp.]
MKPHQEDVRHRILVAARSEFAAYGLAGARIDRIARDGRASKERLYAYFSDKSALFQAVLDLNSREFFEAVPLHPNDVAGFVGGVFDHAVHNPEHLRILTWARLDGIAYELPPGPTDHDHKLAAIRDAQAAGRIDASWNADELLTLLFSLGLARAQAPGVILHKDSPENLLRHRRAAVEAAKRLLAPTSP